MIFLPSYVQIYFTQDLTSGQVYLRYFVQVPSLGHVREIFIYLDTNIHSGTYVYSPHIRTCVSPYVICLKVTMCTYVYKSAHRNVCKSVRNMFEDYYVYNTYIRPHIGTCVSPYVIRLNATVYTIRI